MGDGSTVAVDLCLPVGCYVVLFEQLGSNPEEMAFDLCGFSGTAKDVIFVCVNDALVCTASAVSPGVDSCSSFYIPFYMFDTGNNGWEGNAFALTDASGSQVVHLDVGTRVYLSWFVSQVAGGILASGFSGVVPLCLQVTLPASLGPAARLDIACYLCTYVPM